MFGLISRNSMGFECLSIFMRLIYLYLASSSDYFDLMGYCISLCVHNVSGLFKDNFS